MKAGLYVNQLLKLILKKYTIRGRFIFDIYREKQIDIPCQIPIYCN